MRKMQLILLLIVNCFCDATYTIRADGSGNFLTAQACEDANSGSYTGLGVVTCQFTQDGTYLGQLTVAGQTNTSAINYLKFIGGGYTKTILDRQGGEFTTIFTQTPYTQFCCMTISGSYPSGVPYAFQNNTTNTIIDRCVIRATANNANYVMLTTVASSSLTVKNSVIKNPSSTSGISHNNGSTGDYYNCNILTNLQIITSIISLKNCVVYTRVGGTGTTITHTNTYCLDASYTSCTTNGSFASSGILSDSIHIAKSSPLYRTGVDLSASGVVTDIDNRKWTTPYSIGSDDPTSTNVCRSILFKMGVAPRCR